MNEHTKIQIQIFKENERELKRLQDFYIHNTHFEEEIKPTEERLKKERQERRRTFFNSLKVLTRGRVEIGQLVAWQGKNWLLQKYDGDKAILFSHHGKRTVLASQIKPVE